MAAMALTGHFAFKAIPKNRCISVLYIQSSSYSSNPSTPNIAAYKRGTGGRSSFNGIVATVFGCTGFVGRYVCNKLGKIGTQMILPYRSDFYDAQRLKVCGDLGQVLFTPYDIRDEESIVRAIKYSNVVINLIGRDYETKNFKYNDVHVEGPRTIARLCRENGVQRFIHVSYLNSRSDKPKPLVMKTNSQYKISKWCGEMAVREEFPTATILRASDIYGSEDRFLRSFASPWRRTGPYMSLYKQGLETIKQPVYVSDVAQGIVNALRDPDTACKIYQAVGPKRYLLSDLVDWFQALMRKDEKWGFKRIDMKYDLALSMKVALTHYVSPAWPLGYLHWEGLEKEATSDVVDCNLPTLEDLGVNLTHMEDQVPWELKPFRAYQYYIAHLGEFPTPPNPRAMPNNA